MLTACAQLRPRPRAHTRVHSQPIAPVPLYLFIYSTGTHHSVVL